MSRSVQNKYYVHCYVVLIVLWRCVIKCSRAKCALSVNRNA